MGCSNRDFELKNEKEKEKENNDIINQLDNDIDYNLNNKHKKKDDEKINNIIENNILDNNKDEGVGKNSDNIIPNKEEEIKLDNKTNISYDNEDDDGDYYNSYIINSTIIWIDANIDNNEFTEYIAELNDFGSFKIEPFKNIDDTMRLLKHITFEKTYIILNPKLYHNFVDEFKRNINDIYTIPKIILFMSKKDKIIKNSTIFLKNINHPFYTLGGITKEFEDIKKFLLNPIKKKSIKRNDEGQLTFEYIDCIEKLALPLFYKALIDITTYNKIEEFTNYAYKNYSEISEDVKDLLLFIKNISDIPTELLAKYYAKLYTADSKEGTTPFYSDLNRDLRENKKDKYLPYIKILYEGVKLKALPLASHKILYRGTLISNNELNIINNHLDNKKENLPGAIVFSRAFLSFSKKIEVAKEFLNKNENKNKNLSKALLILEKDDNINYSLATHADIDRLSFFEESEVLFFPFSTFEVKEVKETKLNTEKIYEIKLFYLGKYLKEIEKNLNESEKKIPESQFKKEIVKFGLIEEKKVNTEMKELIQHYEEHKEKIDKIPDKINISIPLENYIVSEIEVNEGMINQNIKIIGSYEECFEKNENNEDKKIRINNKYCNEKEIKENCEIRINGLKIDFCYYYQFEQAGIYKIEYIFKKKLQKINHLFYDCKYLTKIDLSNLVTLNISETKYMFYGCENLISINLSNCNTKNVYDMEYMFYGCKSLTELNLSDFDTINVYNMKKMFNDCNSLTNINLTKFNTQNATDMSYMFSGCSSLANIDLSNFNTKNTIDMSYLFSGCNSLTDINLSSFNTENVNIMIYMFSGCYSLKKLDLSSFNTENVINMRNMFIGCENIESINLSSFKTQNVTDMGGMFKGCNSLQELDLSKFNTKNVTDMKCMFDGCKSLKYINLTKFNTEKVINMGYMFYDCNSLEDLDISNFTTENVDDVGYMFGACHKLSKLNLNNFNITNANEMRYIFYDCKSLKKENIITKDSTILELFNSKGVYKFR